MVKSLVNSLLALVFMMVPASSAWAQFANKDADDKYAVELLKPGTQAPDFKLADANGKKKSLAKLFKGHYTVVDFWASWCPDCRKDIPNIQRIYEEFAPKGVQFVGISFDDNAEKWNNAINTYQIPYTQLSELKRMRDSEVAKAYGVKWIPSMMLLDKEGKVVLSTVLSDKLEKTLTELMAKEAPVAVNATTQSVSIDGAKGQLSAIITRPQMAQDEKCPIVMLCHGFSGNKNETLFTLLADSLANKGIASIRFDFNGHGESEGEFVNMTVPNEIEDAMAVYEYVRDMRFVSDVAILGHSQGGVVASMTAGKLGSDAFKSVVLMAPAAVLRDDAIRGNTMGKMYDPLDPPEFVELYGGRKLGRDYIKTAFSLPIYETAAPYRGWAMVIHGTGDRVVPYTYGERYHDVWPQAEVVTLEAFDHGFSQNVYRAVHIATDFLVKTLK